MTALTRDYLAREYVEKARSPADIAVEAGTYPNAVRRALKKFGFLLRNRSDAQKKAIKSGRRTHPTLGLGHSAETRQLIGEAVSAAWEMLDDEEKGSRVEASRARWEALTQTERDQLRDAANAGLRSAAVHGSRLEWALFDGLTDAGHHVQWRKQGADLLLPDRQAAIVVDGPSHFLPVWGQAALARTQESDRQRDTSLRDSGLRVVRIKYLSKILSRTKFKRLLTDLLKMLDSGHVNEHANTLEVC